MAAESIDERGARGRLYRIAAARALVNFGRMVLSVAVGWELYDRTGSPITLGLVGLVQVAPVIALFLPAGWLIDHVDRRVVSTTSAVISGLAGVGLAVASHVDAPVPSYFACLFALGCGTALHAPAAAALTPTMVPRAMLPRANAVLASTFELALILGPTAAGFLLWAADPAVVYGLVGATSALAGGLYASLPRRPQPTTALATEPRDVWIGLRFILRSRLLLPALTLDLFAVLFAGATALLPIIAKDVLEVGPAGLGVLRAAPSLGAIVMAIASGHLRPWRRPGRALLVAVSLYGLATIGFGLSRWFPLSLALLLVGGALDNVSVVIRMTLEQMCVPDSIRGRASAVNHIFIGMSNELGELESGVAAALIGTQPAIVAGGAVALLVCAVVAHRWPALVNMPPLAELEPDTEAARAVSLAAPADG